MYVLMTKRLTPIFQEAKWIFQWKYWRPIFQEVFSVGKLETDFSGNQTDFQWKNWRLMPDFFWFFVYVD